MFTDNPNIEQYEDKLIYIYRNFFSKEYVDRINAIVKKWEGTLLSRDSAKEVHNIDWYVEKTTPLIPELVDGWNQISELMSPEYIIHPQLSLARMQTGEEMFVHADSPGEDMEEDLTQIDLWSTCCILTWGLVGYFGEFTGGDIYYPGIDGGISVSVYPGDLIIHSALHPYEHGVKPVESGTRYAFSNFSLKTEKNPGTFYNYGTPECSERQKDYWNFMIPLKTNPQFPQVEKFRSESREQYESSLFFQESENS
jgi:hypothetical protein